MISPDFLQVIKRVSFNQQPISYNNLGYAVLPSYSITSILASVQQADSSQLKFLPEGTHYSDYQNIYTDNDIYVDSTGVYLGDYFIIDNQVYKTLTNQNYKAYASLSTNHEEALLCRDNRLTYNGTTISLPIPQIDSVYAPMFNLIKLVASCFPAGFNVLWASQQELRPAFPFCSVSIESVQDLESTNHEDYSQGTLTFSRSQGLSVNFSFYSYDKIEAFSLIETFKLKSANSPYATSQSLAMISTSNESSSITSELYESRSIFCGKVNCNFSLEVAVGQASSQTIDKVAFTLSAH
jgi:hypothetical protein